MLWIIHQVVFSSFYTHTHRTDLTVSAAGGKGAIQSLRWASTSSVRLRDFSHHLESGSHPNANTTKYHALIRSSCFRGAFCDIKEDENFGITVVQCCQYLVVLFEGVLKRGEIKARKEVKKRLRKQEYPKRHLLHGLASIFA